MSFISLEEFEKLPKAKERKRYNWDMVQDGEIHTSKTLAQLIGCNEATASYWLKRNNDDVRQIFDEESGRYRYVYRIKKR